MDPKRKFSIFPKREPPPTNTFIKISQPKPDEVSMSQSKVYGQGSAKCINSSIQSNVQQFKNISLLQVSNIYKFIRTNPFMKTAPLKSEIAELDYSPSFFIKNGELIVNQNSDFYRQVNSLRNQSMILNNSSQTSERDVANLSQSFQNLSRSWMMDEKVLQNCQARAEQLLAQSIKLQMQLQKIEEKIDDIAAQPIQMSVSPPSNYFQKRTAQIQVNDILETSMIYSEEQIAQIVRQRNEQNPLRIPELKNSTLMSSISVKQIPSITESETLINLINKEHFAIEPKKIKKLEQLIAITQKKYLMNFRLLYRVTQDCIFGAQSDILDKKGLLFLIKSSHGKFFGAYLSIVFEEQTSDDKAFIFSIQSDNVHKLPVNQDDHYDAATTDKGYIVCFGRDLMISRNCLEEESYCEWPKSYSGYRSQGNDWLVGGHDFHISAMDIYQVE